ncbi:hypothetical protein GUJ93_ZPchr0006g43768 [Zizania palustris]|uniref:Uncharacterized protein n=1 Tax=Zizania palustris TaxID=103762 RepID=A0A8J5T169_ZIZPA|nr:hypothetical protein GUJ93_ZPchr0006g43768 [Zizania palustris]
MKFAIVWRLGRRLPDLAVWLQAYKYVVVFTGHGCQGGGNENRDQIPRQAEASERRSELFNATTVAAVDVETGDAVAAAAPQQCANRTGVHQHQCCGPGRRDDDDATGRQLPAQQKLCLHRRPTNNNSFTQAQRQ